MLVRYLMFLIISLHTLFPSEQNHRKMMMMMMMTMPHRHTVLLSGTICSVEQRRLVAVWPNCQANVYYPLLS